MQLQLLGGLDLQPPVDLGRKNRLVLAALALVGEKGVGRSQLCALFWPDRETPQARSSLRQALTAIRKLAGADDGAVLLDGDPDTIRLSTSAISVDAHGFRRGVETGSPEALRTAAQLYAGDLLAGVELPADAEDWFATHRRAYRQQALGLVELLSKLETEDAQTTGQALAERLLAADAAAEEAHRALIRIFLRKGRANAAIRQFDECRAALQRELGTEPDWETAALVKTPVKSLSDDLQSNTDQIVPAPPLREADELATARSGVRPSVVVMPFDNLGVASDEYFADGVVEEITAALSRIRDFLVIARQSAFAYKGRFVDARQVGSDLGVNYLVEGTVRRGGERLRISVHLVDAQSGTQLWSDRYEGTAADLFSFQDQIAERVAGAMNPAIRLAEIAAAKRKPPNSLRAYDLVMRAFPRMWGENANAVDQAISSLRQAISVDAGYGRAHAFLAWCHALRIVYMWSPSLSEELAATLQSVDAATASGSIDDDPTALTAVGAALSLCGELQKAVAFLDRALTLDPNNAWAWTRLGWAAIYLDEPGLAISRFEKAMSLSPLDPFAFNMKMGLAAALARSGDVARALAIAKDVVAAHPDVSWAYRQLAAYAMLEGDTGTAHRAAQRVLSIQPDFSVSRYVKNPAFQSTPTYRDKIAAALREAGLPD